MSKKHFSVVKRFYFPGSQEFRVDRFFNYDSDIVNIRYLGQNFQRYIAPQFVNPQPRGFYSANVLLEDVTAQKMIKLFGKDRVIIPPVVLWYMMVNLDFSFPTDGRTCISIWNHFSLGCQYYSSAYSLKAYPLNERKNGEKKKPREWYKGNQIILRDI